MFLRCKLYDVLNIFFICVNNFVFSIVGKYYLVDLGYANKLGFLAPYRSQNYHLHNRRCEGGDSKKELFNYRYTFLRNAVERTFNILEE